MSLSQYEALVDQGALTAEWNPQMEHAGRLHPVRSSLRDGKPFLIVRHP